MTNGIDILLTLAAIIGALEVVLFLLRGTLLRLNDTSRLERQAKEAQEELRAVKARSQERQAELNTAREQAEAALAVLRQASRELQDSQRPKEVLVHKLGDAADGTQFRATLRKTLPDQPEDNQVLLWSFENFVDVWATSPQRAHAIASRHFAEKAGYVIGPFAPKLAPSASGAAPDGAMASAEAAE